MKVKFLFAVLSLLFTSMLVMGSGFEDRSSSNYSGPIFTHNIVLYGVLGARLVEKS